LTIFFDGVIFVYQRTMKHGRSDGFFPYQL